MSLCTNQNTPPSRKNYDNNEKLKRSLIGDEEQRRRELLAEIRRIDHWTNAAADNGLFNEIKKDKYKKKNLNVEPEASSVEETGFKEYAFGWMLF